MRLPAAVIVLLLLAGCASSPPAAVDWQFDGKVSLRTGGETQVATISWRQRGDTSGIRLSGPVGMGAVRIDVDAKAMEINTGEETQVIPLDAPIEVDGRRLVLPWRAIAYWVRGLAGDGTAIPAEGLVVDGWQVSILRTGDAGPRLMTFEHPAATLRLSISKWLISGN